MAPRSGLKHAVVYSQRRRIQPRRLFSSQGGRSRFYPRAFFSNLRKVAFIAFRQRRERLNTGEEEFSEGRSRASDAAVLSISNRLVSARQALDRLDSNWRALSCSDDDF